MTTRCFGLLAALALAGCQRTQPTERAAPSPHPPAMAIVASEPPWTLTAADGAGLELTRVDAKVVVQGPLAFTELHLYFHNSEPRVREGTFAITLPPGATVSRFAMSIDDRWQEAEVVDKAVARRVYEDFLHRRQDPALLEKAAGNQFTARVFPIPPHADKHLVLAFSQELAGRGYTLPLRGLPKTARVDVHLAATLADHTHHDQTLSERDWLPDRDFIAALPPLAAVTSGSLVVAAVPFAADSTSDAPSQLTLLVDTSASRGLGFAGYVRSIHALIDALRTQYGDSIQLQVVAFDQDSEPIFDGVAADYGDAQDAALIARGAAGASNLAQVIETVHSAGVAVHRRVVVVTDGVLTAGPELPALVAAIKQLPIERLDVVLAGGLRDERLAASIARGGLPHAGDVYDLDRDIAEVATGLGEQVRTDVAIEIAGATWVSPSRVPAARPGATVLVYARMAKPAQAIEITLGDTRRTIGLGNATPALIERAVAGAEIEDLEAKLAAEPDAAAAAQLRHDIAVRSVASRVISSQTAMLVLETDEDYARYQIDRTTLADILVVGPHGLEQSHRTTFVASNAPSAHVIAQGDLSSGFDDTNAHDATAPAPNATGRYGTIGTGHGTASGYGAGGGGGRMVPRVAMVPTVAIAQPTVSGDIDRSIIRRYIRRNLQKITYCYEKELVTNPTLAGTIQAHFVITAKGTVSDASASGFDAAVASCVAAVIKDIEFPSWSGDSVVQINYPFRFQPSEDATATATTDRTDEAPSAPTIPAVDQHTEPLTGQLADVMHALRDGHLADALATATQWHAAEPGNVLALVALGESLEATKQPIAAARIYGSIIDLFPTRADLRRFAGERLERLGPPARRLAIDTYRKAVADRPDHLTGHRLLAYALVRDADYAGGFAAILAGIDRTYPYGRFAGGDRVLREDAGLIAASYLAHGGTRADILAELAKRSIELATQPSTRFVLYWETDDNDVDLHIRDSHGGHAWYEHLKLASGGALYADVTTGYGPECFTIEGTPSAGPYQLSLNYFSQGPMGYGMGLLQIERFDGKELAFDDRPYVIMTDHAFVDLGTL